MRAKTFTGSERIQVSTEAMKWRAAQKTVRQISTLARYSPENQGEWTITIRYEQKVGATQRCVRVLPAR